MDVGDKALEAIGHEFHRPAHRLGHRGDGDLIGIDMHLDAEAAADIAADDADRTLLHPQLLGEDALHHVRRLGGVVDGQRALGPVVVGQDAAPFQRHAGMTAGQEGCLHHAMRGGEGGGHIALLRGAGEAEVVPQRGMDHHRIGVERRLDVELRGQGLPLHRQGGDAILCGRAAVGDHGDNRLSLPGRTVQRQRMLLRGFHALQVIERRDPGIADLGEVRAGEDAHHARHLHRGGAVHRQDARMGVGAAQERRVHQAWRLDVVRVGGAALHQLRQIGAGNGAADIGVWQVLPRQPDGGGGRHVVHRAAPPRASSVASTASTIAW